MCFAFGNLENFSENKLSLLSLLQLIHELNTAKMKSVGGEYFFYGKPSAFDIYFNKKNQMLKIISERGENCFR